MPLSASEMRMLQRMRLNPRRSFHGRVRGERLTRQKGLSLEFADYREYSEGDDLRHLDWNVLARLKAPVIRTYRDEQDLAVYLLLDTSASMTFGEPSKLDSAKHLALAIGFAALSGGDAVYPVALPMSRAPSALRGWASYPRLEKWVDQMAASAKPRTLRGSLREFAGGGFRPGIVVLLSDGFDEGAAAEISLLGGRGHEVWMVQTLAADELDPDLEGDLKLLDSESEDTRELTATSSMVETYLARLKAHNAGLKAAAERFGGRACQAVSNKPIAKVLNGPMRREGWFTT